MTIYEILDKWTGVYCAGCKMPKKFRAEASNIFNIIYVKSVNNKEASSFTKTNKKIFRVYGIDYGNKRPLIEFDNLYYSFSNDIDGIKSVINHDSYLKSDIIIIEAKPRNAINLTALLNDLYVNYSSMYLSENEIVSKLHFEDILSVYHLNKSINLDNYKEYGTPIDLEDVKLIYKEFCKKYLK